jgi:ribonucleoside-diphosphate reductase beta chain
MSKAQYDLSHIPNYLQRKMFLDPAGPVTIQRFEEVKYNKLAKFEETQRGFFWVPEEISLTKDKMDHKEASEAAKHIFTSNVLRQTALDSLQGRAPSQVFGPVCSLPELEALTLTWGFFETSIHSKSYSHIIRNVYGVPKETFNTIHDTKEIIAMAANVGRYYEALHQLNCKKELLAELQESDSNLNPVIVEALTVDTIEHKEAIWMALHASYALEALRFMVSFATSLAMVENKIYIGNGNIISLILQDELLHTEWTAWIINQVQKEDPDFAAIAQRKHAEVYALYMEVIEEEKSWADYLFIKGAVLGLNPAILKDFVDFTAFTRLKEIGIKYLEDHPKVSPIPWFNKHTNISGKQVSLQETESTSYVIGVMSPDVEFDELPDMD